MSFSVLGPAGDKGPVRMISGRSDTRRGLAHGLAPVGREQPEHARIPGRVLSLGAFALRLTAGAVDRPRTAAAQMQP